MGWLLKYSGTFMTLQNVQDYLSKNYVGYFKYVKMDTGEYRFGLAEDTEHKTLADGGTPVSAAFVQITEIYIKISDYSMTLKMGPDNEDYINIPKMFNLPLKEDY